MPPIYRRVNEAAPLVLVQNEVTVGGKYDFWDDDTGVQYQYPNQYCNKIRSGRPFVYYRGVRRVGGRSGTPEYFGTGVIGAIWRDPSIPEVAPKSRWRWYCAVEDYVAFTTPVPFEIAGAQIESITSAGGWRTAVRELPWEAYEKILKLAGMGTDVRDLEFPPIEDVTVSELDDVADLLSARKSGTPGAGGHEGRRRDTQTKAIGDRGEEIVYRHLHRTLDATCTASLAWVAQTERRPGWDIEYKSAEGSVVAVEVKSTSLSRFSSIELSTNEWEAAKRLKRLYHIALVTGASGANPRMGWIHEPANQVESGSYRAEPTGWRLLRNAAN